MVKKFNANCDFGGQTSSVTLYVGDPAAGSHPLNFQSKWLSKERGGNIPESIMNPFFKLAQIAEENRISFEELSAYVIDEINSNNNLANDAKKATELSKESLDSSDSKINKTN